MASATPVVSADKVIAAGAKTIADFAAAKSRVSAIVSTSGTVDGGSVAIEASHDGAVWVKMATFILVEPRNRSWDLPNGAYRYFRANVLDAVTGGGSVSVTFMEGNESVL